jgi:hypothetical protein
MVITTSLFESFFYVALVRVDGCLWTAASTGVFSSLRRYISIKSRWNDIDRENRRTGRKLCPVPLCPPQIVQGQTRAWNRTSAAVRIRRITAWAMALPFYWRVLLLYWIAFVDRLSKLSQSKSNHIAPNTGVISKWWIGQDVVESDRGLI